MRQDMNKIIVERPRKWKGNDAEAARRRDDFEGPSQLGIRAGYSHRALNENLAPLRRYLRTQLGRPWDKVFSEICARIDGRNTVQQHILQHIDDFIAINVDIRADGELIDLGGRPSFFRASHELIQELYVDPHTGLIRLNKNYRSWRRRDAERRERQKADIARRRRVLDDRTLLMLLDGQWFLVVLDTLPDVHHGHQFVDGKRKCYLTAESRYDMVLRRKVSRAVDKDGKDSTWLYGKSGLYAVSKHQLSKREMKDRGLR
jgi:hypothetical protein